MDWVLDGVTRVMVWLGDLVFGLLSVFSPTVNLWIVSALTGVAVLFIWRYTSNQNAIADVRRKISAHLLATRLFKDNLSVTFRAQRQIIWQALRLMALAVQPVLIMTVPFVLVMVQIGLRYEFQPAKVGETTRVTVTYKDGRDAVTKGAWLELPAGVSREAADPCRVESLRTSDWRLTASAPGDYTLRFGRGDDVVSMPLVVGDGFRRLSSIRGGSFWQRLLYSAEPSIPADSAIESVQVHYENRTTPLLFWDIHWLITLLILSLVFALVFKPILKVHM